MTVTAAIVGAGKIGRKHARILAGLPRATVTHVVDIDAEAAAETATAVDAEPSSFERAIDAVDAVYVCTPDDQHVEITKQAIDAGCHTFVEKPLATDPDAAQELVAVASSTDGVHMVGHVLRFDPRYVQLKTALTDAVIGNVVGVETTRLVPRARVRRTDGGYRAPIRLGVHDFDIIEWITGDRFVAIQAQASGGALHAAGFETEDLVTINGELESGAIVSMSFGYGLPDGHPGSITGARIVGTDGVTRTGGAETQQWTNDGGHHLDTHLWPEIGGRPGGALERQNRALIEAITANGPSPIPFEAGARAVRIAAATNRSIDEDRRVSIDGVSHLD